MSSYTNPPQLTRISKRLWRVDVGFEYYVGHKGSAYVVKVADGTLTDLASIPRFLQWLLPPDGQYHSRFARWVLRLFGLNGWDWGYAHAAIAHDELYRLGIATKFIADVVFYEAMTTSRVYKWLRLIMYLAVRIGGKGNYEKETATVKLLEQQHRPVDAEEPSTNDEAATPVQARTVYQNGAHNAKRTRF